MLNPQLGQAHHMATTIDFLRGAQGAGTRITDTVIGDVLTITVGQLDLGLGVVPAPQLLQVQGYAQAKLVAVARGLVVVVAAMQVGTHFTDIIGLDVDTLLDQLGALTAPVAGHPFRIGTERFISVDTACTQAQRHNGRQLASQTGTGHSVSHPLNPRCFLIGFV